MNTSLLKRVLSAALVIALLVCGVSMTAGADPVTAELTVLDSPMNMAISVTYTDDGTGAAPVISFIDPLGVVYAEGTTPADQLLVERVNNKIYYYIPGAMSGVWQIVYDSAFTGRLEVTTAPYSRDLVIEQFAITQILDDSAEVSFLASFPENCFYNYEICAVTTDSTGAVVGTKELCQGYGTANLPETLNVPLYDLATYEDYRLQLEVYYDDYGVETGSTALSDAFGYLDPDAPDMMDDFTIILNRANGDLTVDWSQVEVYSADSYILGVFSSLSGDEPVYTNTFDPDVTSTSILVDPAAEWLRIDLSYMSWNEMSQVKSMTIRPNDVKFSILTGENTSASQAQIQYEIPSGSVELYAYTEGQEEVKPFEVSGSGTVAVNIAEFENTLCVAYRPSETVTILETKEIYSDRKAPILTFFEDLNPITTSDAVFRVAGMTEAGAVVTVNGKAAAINADGSFLIELTLVSGANSFEFISADQAGNQSKRTLLINRSEVAAVVGSEDVQPFWRTWLPLMITAAASLALAILILGLFGGKKELTTAQTLKRWSILGYVLTGCSGAVTVWLLVEMLRTSNVVNSVTFFELVQTSIDEAYEALLRWQGYEKWFLPALIATCVLLLISVGFTVASNISKKNRNKPPKPPKEPKPPKAPKAPKQEAPAPVVEPAPAPVVESAPAPVVGPAPAPQAKPKPRFCPECGTRCQSNGAFCSNCGKKLL